MKKSLFHRIYISSQGDVDKIRDIGEKWKISNKAKEVSKFAVGLGIKPDLKVLR